MKLFSQVVKPAPGGCAGSAVMLARMPADSRFVRSAAGVTNTDTLARARRFRRAGRVALALWMIGWVLFAIVVATNGNSDLVSALAVLICLMFAVSFVLEARARRLEAAASVLRDELIASRSRRTSRVR
jgi:uncharacterized membrane protein